MIEINGVKYYNLQELVAKNTQDINDLNSSVTGLNEDIQDIEETMVTESDLENYYTKTEIDTEFNDYYTKSQVDTALSGKQPNLVDGVNIKKINGLGLVGGGNLVFREPSYKYHVYFGYYDGSDYMQSYFYVECAEESNSMTFSQLALQIMKNGNDLPVTTLGATDYKTISSNLSTLTLSSTSSSKTITSYTDLDAYSILPVNY